MALNIAYFAWVRERMGIADETIDVPVGIADVGALVAWLAARDAQGRSPLPNRTASAPPSTG